MTNTKTSMTYKKASRHRAEGFFVESKTYSGFQNLCSASRVLYTGSYILINSSMLYFSFSHFAYPVAIVSWAFFCRRRTSLGAVIFWFS